MSGMSGRASATTRIHIMALDGIVNVNSLFTLALFLGLTSYPITSLLDPTSPSYAACIARTDIAEGLVAFHVYSFSSFLFSSLIALALKQAINIKTMHANNGIEATVESVTLVHVNVSALRFGILASAIGSVAGCGFLMLALVDLVQIKLGTLACGSLHTFAAVGPLVVLVPLALVIYVLLVLFAFFQ
ncbi:uncharacterized protein LOC120005511 [Tripterygium wilfordii]|uniref:uncharacterized protein LOC120005511 n=1 Tax=Tripterygium wilfordii TaxID=458696 RepID=UPI0018F82A89|nr:uncharacterized protein LOC120005511 [Tripterygium wilfordii]XP_038711115.1 uncharacterized protein LOC120005511 [Tripterygium wilfordii]